MKTAVFYDLENIAFATKNGDFEQAMTELSERITASDLVDSIVLQRAYICKNHRSFPTIAPVLKKLGIELVAVESLSRSVNKKSNLVDFKMGVDIVSTIMPKRSIGTVAIASGDNDFGFLCEQIKQMGRKLLVISRFNTTGDIMMKLCDDWIDLNEQVLSPKYIRNAIETRIPEIRHDGDFFTSFGSFMQTLGNDILLRRYMAEFGLPFALFASIFHSRNFVFPRHGELGFPSFSAFMDVLLSETDFECRNGIVKYCGKSKNRLPQKRLIENIVRPPSGYTREKLHKYYDICAGIDNIDEFQTYLVFMRRNGMLKGSKLCQKRIFRSAIRNNLRAVMEKAGITMDEKAFSEFCEKL